MYPQRCPDERPHGPHDVPPRGTWTGFTCVGRWTPEEFEALLDEAFGS